MSTGTQITKVHGLTSDRAQSLGKNGSRLMRFLARIQEGCGTGSRRPEFYSSMSQKQLEQRAQEDMAIARTMGF
jgi:hypothetical protein